MPGRACFQPPQGCLTESLTLPVLDYGRSDGRAVIGGVVCRGRRMPGYQGSYFHADEVSRIVRSFRLTAGQVSEPRDWTASLAASIRNPSSFGVDQDGEMYVVDYGGSVLRVEPR